MSHTCPMCGAPVEVNLDMSIDDLGFPCRAWRAVNRRGIRTLGDLLTVTEADLRKEHGIGRGTIAAISSILERHGLRLAESRQLPADNPA
jgi:DNA-directed RNA polymerase subunit alpha